MKVPKVLTRLFRFSCLLSTVTMLAGCSNTGPDTYPVSGRVTCQGKPVTTGSVSFVPLEGPMAGASINAGGGYSLNALAGKYRVAVTAIPPPPPGVNPMQDPDGYVPPASLIPTKYNRISTSGLTVEVKASAKNTIDLDLP